ncbi:MAG: enoyl-CoA hydratase/isomerase family protein [Pseudomonadota bacterium]
MNDESSVLFLNEGQVVTVTLNRPSALNALNDAMARELLAAAQKIRTLPEVRVVVLRGAGVSFCGGGDVAAMHANRDDMTGFIVRLMDKFHASLLVLRRLPVPVIASVQGAAAGGGFSLAMACDLVIASRSARFVAAYPRLGTTADGGLSFSLTQRLGPKLGLEALTLQDSLGAERAAALGLVNRVVDDELLEQETAAWARRLCDLPVQSVAGLKGLVAAQADAAFAAHLDLEKAAFIRCAATPDFADRVAAFAAKASARAARS